MHQINDNKLIKQSYKLYEEMIKNIIHTKYFEYESRIAVGLAGEGSECFIYDDEISKDHDYEVSLCMWLTDRDYEEIGEELNNEYIKVVEEYGVKNKIFIKSLYSKILEKRRGAMKISDFYSSILGIKIDEDKKSFTENEFSFIEDRFFATSSNGMVFRDDLGKFTNIRNLITAYYPERVYKLKLKQQLHLFSQYGQSNYGRCMARGDYVTAKICISNCMLVCMNILCLLEKKYAPYYKWLRKVITDMGKYNDIEEMINEILLLPNEKEAWENYKYNSRFINNNDRVEVMIDKLGLKLAKTIYEKGLISVEDSKISYLEGLVNKLL